MENIVEVTPSSPPKSRSPSPEIRVTDSPISESEVRTKAPLIFQPFLPLPINQQALPFSIDNILKPNFGANVPAPNSRSFPAFFSTLAAAHQLAAANAAINKVETTRQRSPSSSSSSNGSLVKSELKSPPSSPLNHNNNQPVDLSKTTNNSAAEKTGKEGEDGVPPGMVRGPNGQLWPAWVFCTRYSDRPSSGKFFIFIPKKSVRLDEKKNKIK